MGRSNGILFVHGTLRVGEAMAPPLINQVRSCAEPEKITIQVKTEEEPAAESPAEEDKPTRIFNSLNPEETEALSAIHLPAPPDLEEAAEALEEAQIALDLEAQAAEETPLAEPRPEPEPAPETCAEAKKRIEGLPKDVAYKLEKNRRNNPFYEKRYTVEKARIINHQEDDLEVPTFIRQAMD